jgi:hypothetical protein
MSKEDGCKSPIHQPDCPCQRCNKSAEKCITCPTLKKQYEIPKIIGKKILGISNEQLEEHSHYESEVCLKANNAKVKKVFTLMDANKKDGVFLSTKTVLVMRKTGYFK